LLFTAPAQAVGIDACGALDTLEQAALKGNMATPTRDCIDENMWLVDPGTRVRMSFVLIVDAYAKREIKRYVEMVERHLGSIHTTDADVAYLYALHLSEAGPAMGEEVVRWANVALANRNQWLENHRTYRVMVRSLYNIRNESSMERAILAKKWYRAEATPESQRRLEQYQKRARYYLAVSGPCLVQGDCGPHFVVEVDEQTAECEELDHLERKAKANTITDEEVDCLKWRYPKTGSRKARILSILAAWADKADEAPTWEALMSWHRNETGYDSAWLAYRYADHLGKKGELYALEVIRWSTIAFEHRDQLEGQKYEQEMYGLLKLRVQAAEDLVRQQAYISEQQPDDVEAQGEVAKARMRNKQFRAEIEAWCQSSDVCPEGWAATLTPAP
jgi:hypothetical protein